jgi:hypothetical protein
MTTNPSFEPQGPQAIASHQTAGRRRDISTLLAARGAGGWGAERTPTHAHRTQHDEAPSTSPPPMTDEPGLEGYSEEGV